MPNVPVVGILATASIQYLTMADTKLYWKLATTIMQYPEISAPVLPASSRYISISHWQPGRLESDTYLDKTLLTGLFSLH